MRENLLQRFPVHPRLAENLTLADLLDQNATTNLCPLFPVRVHLPTSESDHFGKGISVPRELIGDSNGSKGAAHFLRPATHRTFSPPFTLRGHLVSCSKSAGHFPVNVGILWGRGQSAEHGDGEVRDFAVTFPLKPNLRVRSCLGDSAKTAITRNAKPLFCFCYQMTSQ